VRCSCLYASALRLQARWRFGFYDSLIVAAALEGGCRRLLSEDLQHGQRIETLTIEDPFRRK
jgi:predicted nucleic acid-binding protein